MFDSSEPFAALDDIFEDDALDVPDIDIAGIELTHATFRFNHRILRVDGGGECP